MDLSPYIPWTFLIAVRRTALWLSGAALALLVVFALWPDAPAGGDEDVLVTDGAAVAPGKNSYSHLQRVAGELKLTKEEEAQVRECADGSPCDRKALAAALLRNRAVLSRIDAFRGTRLVPPGWEDPAKITYETGLPPVLPLVRATQLAVAQGRLLALEGRHQEALERYLSAAEMGTALGDEPVSLIFYATGVAIRVKALRAAGDLLELKTSLSPASCKAALARLGGAEVGRAGLRRALRMEYTLGVNLIATLDPAKFSGGGRASRVRDLLALRFFKRNGSRRMLAADFREQLRRLDEPCPIERSQPPQPRVWTHPQFWRGNLVGVVLHSVASPDFDRMLRRRCEESFWTDAVRVSLAARAFAAETGRAPRSLAELWPKYLPKPLSDPFGGGALELTADGILASAAPDSLGQPLALRVRAP